MPTGGDLSLPLSLSLGSLPASQPARVAAFLPAFSLVGLKTMRFKREGRLPFIYAWRYLSPTCTEREKAINEEGDS